MHHLRIAFDGNGVRNAVIKRVLAGREHLAPCARTTPQTQLNPPQTVRMNCGAAAKWGFEFMGRRSL